MPLLLSIFFFLVFYSSIIYSWDFDYDEKKGFKSSQLIDKDGKHAGNHTIAVKVVDNEGLETVEIIKLKVNGGVKKL